MSVESMLIIQPDKLPTYEAIRDEARKKSDPVELFGSVDLRAHTGYLPMRAYGRETGFEYHFGMTSEGEVSSDAHQFGTHRILTRTGSDFEEGRAALLFYGSWHAFRAARLLIQQTRSLFTPITLIRI